MFRSLFSAILLASSLGSSVIQAQSQNEHDEIVPRWGKPSPAGSSEPMVVINQYEIFVIIKQLEVYLGTSAATPAILQASQFAAPSVYVPAQPIASHLASIASLRSKAIPAWIDLTKRLGTSVKLPTILSATPTNAISLPASLPLATSSAAASTAAVPSPASNSASIVQTPAEASTVTVYGSGGVSISTQVVTVTANATATASYITVFGSGAITTATVYADCTDLKSASVGGGSAASQVPGFGIESGSVSGGGVVAESQVSTTSVGKVGGAASLAPGNSAVQVGSKSVTNGLASATGVFASPASESLSSGKVTGSRQTTAGSSAVGVSQSGSSSLGSLGVGAGSSVSSVAQVTSSVSGLPVTTKSIQYSAVASGSLASGSSTVASTGSGSVSVAAASTKIGSSASVSSTVVVTPSGSGNGNGNGSVGSNLSRTASLVSASVLANSTLSGGSAVSASKQSGLPTLKSLVASTTQLSSASGSQIASSNGLGASSSGSLAASSTKSGGSSAPQLMTAVSSASQTVSGSVSQASTVLGSSIVNSSRASASASTSPALNSSISSGSLVSASTKSGGFSAPTLTKAASSASKAMSGSVSQASTVLGVSIVNSSRASASASASPTLNSIISSGLLKSASAKSGSSVPGSSLVSSAPSSPASISLAANSTQSGASSSFAAANLTTISSSRLISAKPTSHSNATVLTSAVQAAPTGLLSAKPSNGTFSTSAVKVASTGVVSAKPSNGTSLASASSNYSTSALSAKPTSHSNATLLASAAQNTSTTVFATKPTVSQNSSTIVLSAKPTGHSNATTLTSAAQNSSTSVLLAKPTIAQNTSTSVLSAQPTSHINFTSLTSAAQNISATALSAKPTAYSNSTSLPSAVKALSTALPSSNVSSTKISASPAQNTTVPVLPTTQNSTQYSNTTRVCKNSCQGNTASTRSQWCNYTVNSNYIDESPETGCTVEVYLSIEAGIGAPDGVSRYIQTVNGSIPGPTIFANWGDDVVVHVTNNIPNNGTTIHFHGIRQNWTNLDDGVPSITQCPIAPGNTHSYRWKAVQYGTSWYHSHVGLQAYEGVHGAIVINGPSSANYDVDLGPVFLEDWTHATMDALYSTAVTKGGVALDTGLINGTNVWNAGSAAEAAGTTGVSGVVPSRNIVPGGPSRRNPSAGVSPRQYPGKSATFSYGNVTGLSGQYSHAGSSSFSGNPYAGANANSGSGSSSNQFGSTGSFPQGANAGSGSSSSASAFAQASAQPSSAASSSTSDNDNDDATSASVVDDADQVGQRFEVNVVSGSTYLMRIISSAINTQWKFSIDNHTMKVVSADLVPIVPYETDVLNIAIAQRYDIIITANQGAIGSDFWIRSVPQQACSDTGNIANIRGILHYGGSTGTPTTTGFSYVDECVDEPMASLVPIVPLSVDAVTYNEDIDVTGGRNANGLLNWYINGETFIAKWDDPTLLQVFNGDSNFTVNENLIEIPEPNVWVYVAIHSHIPVAHPIHLHGHDFVVLAQGGGSYSPNIPLQTSNPPRRDTALLEAGGYLVVAFLTNNPGAWLMHCHIGWHQSEGFDLQFLEREGDLLNPEFRNNTKYDLLNGTVLNSDCDAWKAYTQANGVVQLDAGVKMM